MEWSDDLPVKYIQITSNMHKKYFPEGLLSKKHWVYHWFSGVHRDGNKDHEELEKTTAQGV